MQTVRGRNISELSPSINVVNRNSQGAWAIAVFVFFLLFFLLTQQVAFGQTTIWSEDFEGYSVGAQQGSGTPAKWIISPTNGYSGFFEIRSSGGNEFVEGNNMDQEGVLTTQSIDISGFTFIHLEVDVAESGNSENSDYIRVYYKVDGGTETPYDLNWDNTGNFTSSTATADISGNSVQIIVRVQNNSTNEYHIIDNILVVGSNTPTDCSSTGTMQYDDGITLVNFNTINYSTGKTAGYNDYTSISTDVVIGNSYDLTVNLNTDGNYENYAAVWIDWNINGVFESNEEYDLGRVTNNSNGATSNSPLSITVPVTASTGVTRMRVSTKYNSYPTQCEVNFDGEVEDYSINIIDPCNIVIQNITGGGSYCAGDPGVAVGLDDSEPGVTYQLYRDGITAVGPPISGTGSAISFGNQTAAGTYTVVGKHDIDACDLAMNGSAVVTILDIPVVSSPSDASVTATTAILGGTITDVGCPDITVRGIEYSETNNFPEGTGTVVSETGTFGTGIFTLPVTGLTPNTTYYYKAFATNSVGTAYSAQGSFTTPCQAVGDPAEYGDNIWNVYAYEGNGIGLSGITYQGYYTEPNFSFSTEDRWNLNNSPSDADNYQGCPVSINYHTFVYKREGFPSGTYQITVGHDDGYELYIDNVLVGSSTTWDAENAVVLPTSYALNSTSKIEFRIEEDAGGSRGALTFTLQCTNPTIDDPADVVACESYTLPVLTTGGAYYSSTGGVGSIAVGTTITSTQTIYVYAETGTTPNCWSENSFDVTVNPLPTVVANATSTEICEGESVTLTGGGASSYVWDNGVTDGVSFTPTGTTSYTVTGTDGNGCENTDQITITVNPLPTITTQPVTLDVCDGGSGDFTVATSSSSPTYQWQYSTPANPAIWIDIPEVVGVIEGTNSATLQILVASNTWDGYNVSCVITSNGCYVQSDVVQLNVNPLPTPADANIVICADATSTDLTTYDNTVLDGEAGTVGWYNGDTSGSGTLLTPATAVNLNSVADLWAEVTLTATGCKAAIHISVTINPVPTTGEIKPD